MTKLEALGYSSLTAADDGALRELLAQFEEVPVMPAVIDEAIRLRRLHKLKSPDAIIAATAMVAPMFLTMIIMAMRRGASSCAAAPSKSRFLKTTCRRGFA